MTKNKHFRSVFAALLCAVLCMTAFATVAYAITFAFDSVPLLLPYDIRIIIQPRSANAITEIVTKQDFEITFCAWMDNDASLPSTPLIVIVSPKAITFGSVSISAISDARSYWAFAHA